MTSPPDPHYRHRFPAEIISHAVWLYHVFSLSLRDVELILAERGTVVTHESIRHWDVKFGADFARRACRSASIAPMARKPSSGSRRSRPQAAATLSAAMRPRQRRMLPTVAP